MTLRQAQRPVGWEICKLEDYIKLIDYRGRTPKKTSSEYAGKMNFYCSAVDDALKHLSDEKTIGLILCESKDRVFAEYALRDIHKPIGVSEYELTRALPENLKGSLPSIEEIEREMSGGESLNQDLQD
jgi:hypothetical protein